MYRAYGNLEHAPTERNSDLWRTCAHEAAHFVVGTDYGFAPRWPRIIDPMRGHVGYTERVDMPRGLRNDEHVRAWLRESAIVSDAGPVTSAMLESSPIGCESDDAYTRYAIRRLNDPEMTLRDTHRVTKTIVQMRWTRICRVADDLSVQYLATR